VHGPSRARVAVSPGPRRPAHGGGGFLVLRDDGAGEGGGAHPPQPGDRAGAGCRDAGAEHGAGAPRRPFAVGSARPAGAAGAAGGVRLRGALLLLLVAGAPPAGRGQPHPVHQPRLHRHPGRVGAARADGAAGGAVRGRQPGRRGAGGAPRLAAGRRPVGGEPARRRGGAGRRHVQRRGLRHRPTHPGREPAGHRLLPVARHRPRHPPHHAAAVGVAHAGGVGGARRHRDHHPDRPGQHDAGPPAGARRPRHRRRLPAGRLRRRVGDRLLRRAPGRLDGLRRSPGPGQHRRAGPRQARRRGGGGGGRGL
ncbi:MAG: Permease of the drug/metabolite transporter (DMT) superfamily, partial [uncultured Gemmatimonadetes bacterium]